MGASAIDFLSIYLILSYKNGCFRCFRDDFIAAATAADSSGLLMNTCSCALVHELRAPIDLHISWCHPEAKSERE